MSSSFVADTTDDHKSDNTLIIIVNNDGSISVDQETLQNLLASQHNPQNTAVSVVRVGGQGDDSSQDSTGTSDSQNDGSPHLNLTVEGFMPGGAEAEAAVAVAMGGVDPAADTETTPAASSPAVVNSVPAANPAEGESLDPFLEMDSEQLERLETALQSEQAKQILGENVTAMLDMLSVEEEASQLKDTIRMDHNYTSLPTSATPPTPVPSAVPTHHYGAPVSREDGGSILVDQSDRIQQVTPVGMGPLVTQTIRGRGRGRPGRPRRDMSSTRGITYSAQRSLTRGAVNRGVKIQRGGTVMAGSGGNMIMVQQIKPINPPLAPPPSTPSSATLVPVVKPLVMTSGTAVAGQISTASIRTVPGQLQKQIITVPHGARLVTVSGNQPLTTQTVLLTTASGQVVQAQPIQTQTIQAQTLQTQPIQVAASISQVQAQNLNSAKVVVAKMPVLPPQLLGAQPSTLPLSEQPTQRLQKEDESDFTDFPQEASEDSESEESDANSDDEYKDPTVGRRGGRGIKGRGRFSRGGRSRGIHRMYEGSRGSRGGRRGRGRGIARPEDADRAKKLEAEMAAVVASMEKSPEGTLGEKTTTQNVQEKLLPKKEDVLAFAADISPAEGSKKKMMKVRGKLGKSISELSEETHVKVENTVIKEKGEKHATSEKKSPSLKSPVRKQSSESLPSPVSTAAPTTPTAAAAVAGADSRKNYPKRENRKPPAHLADALGPALFSTPDIIRRVSTGPDQKPNSVEAPADEKKDPLKGATEPVESKEKAHEVPETLDQGVKVTTTEITQLQVASSEMMQVSEAESSVLDSLEPEMKSEEQLLAEALLMQEQVNEESKLPEIKKLLSPESTKGSELTETAVLETSQDPGSRILSQQGAGGLKVEGVGGTRSSRRRSSTSVHQNPGEPASKREANKQANTVSKDKKREDKQKGRRLSVDVDDDEEQTSDDESWNSEDDPDRLWCICKKPHNNRFMICCDVCEDWFHGKCVGVTKAMGQQMENKGLDWSCPNCAKKKEEEKETKKHPSPAGVKEKEVKKMKESKKEVHSEPPDGVNAALQDGKVMIVPGDGVAQQGGSSDAQILYCIVCKKLARPSSIYCSDACILKHAQESLNVLHKDKAVAAGAVAGAGSRDTAQQPQQLPLVVQPSSAKGPEAARQGGAGAGQLSKARPDARVIVYERKTGKLLAGPNAPTAGNLKTWLKDNPTFEVVRPGVLPSTKFYGAKGQTKTVFLQSKVTSQKLNSLEPKVSLPLTTSAAVVQTKPNALKANSSPQKALVSHQKVMAASTKTGTLGQKSVLNISSKIVSAKAQKGPIIVAAQPQKVVVKGTAAKSPSTPTKPVAKQSVMNAVSTKGQLSPTKVSALQQTNAVSRAPATSTVKEASKAEKTVVKKVEVKRQSSSSSDSVKKEEDKEKPSGPEPIRLNVRKTLQELLEARIKLCPDLNLPEGEVQNIALNIEEEMHSYFREPGMKYKSKYRSLVFNIKDPKNLTLFRKIADKSVTPYQLVRLTPEELASQELAQWREREAKHQLEMIKKNELDLMTQAKTYVLKTHKGEQEIETDESLKVEVPELVDPSTVPDLVSPVNNSVSSTVEDTELDKVKSKLKDKDSKEKSNKEEKERGRDREKSKHNEKHRDKSERRKDEKERSHHSKHERNKRKDSKERDKKSSSKVKHRSSEKSKHDHDKHKDSKSSRKDKKDEKELKKEEIKKEDFQEMEEVEKSEIAVVHEELKDEPEFHLTPKFELSYHARSDTLDDSDLSDREPSSTVTIKTPDINVEDPERATVWKGFVNMPDVAKFFTSVQVVSGDAQNLYKDLPDTLDIVGRIIPDTVWEYIKKMKKTGTKEILVIRLNAANEEERIQYVTLYTYLNTRNRLGVVGNVSKLIKDFYIMPLASHNPVPDVLLPLDGPGFEDYRPHLLLGILVRARRKRLAPENEYVAKPPKRPVIMPPPIPAEPVERSYTPPLPGVGDDTLGSLTPPHPPPLVSVGSYTPPRSPQDFLPGPSHLVKNSDPRLSRKDSFQEDLSPDEKTPVIKLEKQSLASHVGHYGLDDDDSDSDDDDDDENDDDAPYSPGGSEVESGEDNLLLTPKNPSELQRKVEELNRKIEEQKQQIESISSAMVGSDPAVAALGNESLKSYIMASEDRQGEPEEEDENEAYSPSRSFTPPATIPFIGPAESGSAPVFSTLPSNINLPSNLHEILASIKKQENDKVVGSTSLKGINLKSDPIVQTYGKAPDLDSGPPKTPTEDYSNSAASVSSSYSSASSGNTASPASSSILQSASSALLSLSTPVVHPLMAGGGGGGGGSAAKAAETKTRDPRQRGSEVVTKPSGGSTLSTLSDDDLIKKALEMEMELSEPKINTGVAVDQTTLQQPLPPGVDSMPAGTGPPLKSSLMLQSIPAGQPLPPGVEDEEYPSYSSFGGPAAQSTLPPTMAVPMSPNYSMQTPTSPAPYCMPHHYTGPAYPAPGRTPPQAPGYSSSFVPSGGYSGSKSIEDGSNVPTAKIKRKFSDSEVDESGIKRDRSDSPNGGGRDNWDNKMPVPVRGRFGGVRGRGFIRGSSQRGFIRLRGGVSHNPSQNRSRWDNKDNDRKRPSNYEHNRLEWETHSKDIDEKLRDRPRDRHRDRSRERDKPSSAQRSHSNGRSSSRNKESEKGSESS